MTPLFGTSKSLLVSILEILEIVFLYVTSHLGNKDLIENPAIEKLSTELLPHKMNLILFID